MKPLPDALAVLACCALLLPWPVPVRADPAQHEIETLLVTVGKSGCAFIRNGSDHTSVEAEKHLRLKYRKGKRYADTPEHFIEKLGSGSSWTGKPYSVRCPGKSEQSSESWLTGLLEEQRRTAAAASEAAPTP